MNSIVLKCVQCITASRFSLTNGTKINTTFARTRARI